MKQKLIFVVVSFLFLSSCDNNNHGGNMMGGGGMMGNIEIRGERPPQETNSQYVSGYQQAKITCTQCHTLPHPNQHTSSEWPNVITRMENHIKTYGKSMPDKTELKSIINYYVGNAN